MMSYTGKLLFCYPTTHLFHISTDVNFFQHFSFYSNSRKQPTKIICYLSLPLLLVLLLPQLNHHLLHACNKWTHPPQTMLLALVFKHKIFQSMIFIFLLIYERVSVPQILKQILDMWYNNFLLYFVPFLLCLSFPSLRVSKKLFFILNGNEVMNEKWKPSYFVTLWNLPFHPKMFNLWLVSFCVLIQFKCYSFGSK